MVCNFTLLGKLILLPIMLLNGSFCVRELRKIFSSPLLWICCLEYALMEMVLVPHNCSLFLFLFSFLLMKIVIQPIKKSHSQRKIALQWSKNNIKQTTCITKNSSKKLICSYKKLLLMVEEEKNCLNKHAPHVESVKAESRKRKATDYYHLQIAHDISHASHSCMYFSTTLSQISEPRIPSTINFFVNDYFFFK